MSRYTASELKNFPKAALVECIARQPEIQFPKKISSRPIEDINRKQLLCALTGNFGYIKPVAASPNGAEMRNSSQHVEAFPVLQACHELDVLSAAVEAVCLETTEVEIAPGSPGPSDLCWDDIEIMSTLAEDIPGNAELHAVEVSLPPVSSSESDFVIGWYDEEKPSEIDLLEEYFSRRPRFAKQVSDMKANRGKRQTDGNLVRDYKFTLEVYDHLLQHEWETDSGHILSKTIQKYLGLSAGWFSRARKIVDLVEKIGATDPFVKQRLSSKATSQKGEDILTFLMSRARAGEAL